MEKTVVDGLLERFSQLKAFLRDREEVSLAIEAETNFKKLLIIACGSFFEDELTRTIRAWAEDLGTPTLAAFVQSKGLERQYHTFFDWKCESNVNQFLGLFGDDFKVSVAAKIKDDERLAEGMRAFVCLGRKRNLLAHGNIASAAVDETVEELAEQYHAAQGFCQFLTSHFRSCGDPR